MKRPILSATLCLLAAVASVDAAIVVPGANGTDGALNITQDTVIDLSRAATGSWDQDNTANAGNGVYDADKWAVVFKYTSVNVLGGKKLTFKNHATRAPVVWLVSGNVTISGTVDLSGADAIEYGSQQREQSPPTIPEPGPGGFRGGSGGYKFSIFNVSGFGPGGGSLADGGAAHGTTANSNVSVYGNPSLLPLTGGSGGAGSMSAGMWAGFGSSASGGAGGGAILIAAQESINLSQGALKANGGSGLLGGDFRSGGGAGGGIRLICEVLSGNGQISAVGGASPSLAGMGRIRLERVINQNTLAVTPDPSVVDAQIDKVPDIWPPDDAVRKSPTAKIISIGKVEAPADPLASFGTLKPDIALPATSQVEVVVETQNVEEASTVIVRVTPRTGAALDGQVVNFHTHVKATIKSRIDSVPPKIHWVATVPVIPGHSAIQARVVRP